MTDIARLADQVIVIDSGKLVADGTPEEVFAMKEKLESVGLAVPPETEFTETLRGRGIDISPTILNVDEAVAQIAAYLKNR